MKSAVAVFSRFPVDVAAYTLVWVREAILGVLLVAWPQWGKRATILVAEAYVQASRTQGLQVRWRSPEHALRG